VADTIKITVYLKTGNAYGYDVRDAAKAREHAAAIWATGFRTKTSEDEHTWFGPHFIDKIVWEGPDDTLLAKKYDE
jgi:hypothetical protein